MTISNDRLPPSHRSVNERRAVSTIHSLYLGSCSILICRPTHPFISPPTFLLLLLHPCWLSPTRFTLLSGAESQAKCVVGVCGTDCLARGSAKRRQEICSLLLAAAAAVSRGLTTAAAVWWPMWYPDGWGEVVWRKKKKNWGWGGVRNSEWRGLLGVDVGMWKYSLSRKAFTLIIITVLVDWA